MKGIVGRKVGMTQVFDEETGRLTPVTVIQAGPCPVVSVRTSDTDGYDAVQLGFEEVPEPKLSKGELGHLKKNGAPALRKLVEIRGPHELTPGETVTVEAFEPGDRVKVSGLSIGKGFQGTIKRHRFHRGPETHGSHNVRKPGSIGASATPSRVYKGMRMAGRMGAKQVTQVGLTVVDRDPEQNLLLVKGAVPGHRNSLVVVREDRRR
jgi:large subunit ribosomal protein L3